MRIMDESFTIWRRSVISANSRNVWNSLIAASKRAH